MKLGISIGLGTILGVLIGIVLPTIPYSVSKYLAIGIVAALDTVFGGISSSIKKNFNIGVFASGFFVNAILAILLTYLGQRLNVDIYLAAIVVFVGRIFNNLGNIRRYYIEEISNNRINKSSKSNKTEQKSE